MEIAGNENNLENVFSGKKWKQMIHSDRRLGSQETTPPTP